MDVVSNSLNSQINPLLGQLSDYSSFAFLNTCAIKSTSWFNGTSGDHMIVPVK